MSLSAATIDALVATGATAEMLAAYVKAELAVMDAAQAERRAKASEKKRRQRISSPSVPGTSGDVGGHRGTNGDTLSLPLSPQTPQSPTHTHGDINTHARKADRDPEGFGSFWEAYPRRVGKDEARKAFVKAVKRGVVLGELIGGVERDKARQWVGRDVEMIPHPATWLNQGRWQDEPSPENVTQLRPQNDRPSRQSVQLEERFENYQRALVGAEIAVKRGAIEPSGGF